MELTEIYRRGEESLLKRDIGRLLGYVETGFIRHNDRLVMDRYTFRQKCIDAHPAATTCKVLGLEFKTPIIMSSMTMPIPAICDDGLVKVAKGLQAAGSMMWTGTPLPKNLKELLDTGVNLAANVKPLKDRKKMYAEMDEILEAGVHWLGVEIDSGQGTKIVDKEMGFECTPYTSKEIEDIKKRVNVPLICKGVLSVEDAIKSVDAGANGIVVSSHGGHTLDFLPHAFQVMDEIVLAVKGKTELIIDGGFRRGSDVLKGLAFGASLVGLGRPILYGLAADESAGVQGVIEGITKELVRLMTMVGASETGKIHRDILIEF